jgi:hypothetical protein
VDVTYKSEIFLGLDHGSALSFERDRDLAGFGPTVVLDLRLGWTNLGEDLSVGAFAKNLTDVRSSPVLPMKTLEEEIRFYEEHRHEFLAASPGQFALIRGKQLIGAFSTLQEAYHQGIERFGNVSRLIRQILPAEPAHKIPAFTQGLLRARL